MRRTLLSACCALLLAASGAWDGARAQEAMRLSTTIKDHAFSPAELRAPANRAIVIDVQNADPTAEEFESAELGVEKVIAGGRSLPVRIRPMPPGRYRFMGEYHSETAQGVLVVEGDK